ncbi:helix-turn-helix domain-containing protein [Clostridium sp.]|uniref:helix-turn-helix domain-containing protein n=1 Tax=Clostridium sp. TaxID=1506 RepID=UPI00290878D3|nr:helix-turn-helix domain-containing protein [Clostridium sp.]MDU4477651.1 helix-turn-helix domain-containing protein [Clostridium sp.]
MELLTVKEVSKKLKLCVSDTYKLIRAGHLQALKLGALKVTSLELERFIKEASGKDFSDLNNVKTYEPNQHNN